VSAATGLVDHSQLLVEQLDMICGPLQDGGLLAWTHQWALAMRSHSIVHLLSFLIQTRVRRCYTHQLSGRHYEHAHASVIIMLHEIFIRCGLTGQVQRARSCHSSCERIGNQLPIARCTYSPYSICEFDGAALSHRCVSWLFEGSLLVGRAQRQTRAPRGGRRASILSSL
jgi:hypothetical protein